MEKKKVWIEGEDFIYSGAKRFILPKGIEKLTALNKYGKTTKISNKSDLIPNPPLDIHGKGVATNE